MVLGVRDVGTEDAGAVLLDELGYPSTPAEVRERLEVWLDGRYSRVVGSRSVDAIPRLEPNGRSTCRRSSWSSTRPTPGCAARSGPP
jgi:hypothetical protein